MKKLRVLFVVAGLERGGAERQLSELARWLVHNGHQVTVATAYFGEFYQYILEDAGVTVVPLQASTRPDQASKLDKVYVRLRMLFALGRLLKNGQFNILYSIGIEPNLMIGGLKPLHRKPVIWGVRHSTPGSRSPRSILESLLSRSADRIITNSEAGKRASEAKRFPSSSLQVIENGIDTERFRINEEWRAATREEFGVSANEKLIGIIGRMHPVKDHETFLRAAQSIAKTNPSARFIVVGRDYASRKGELQELAKSLGIAHHVQWTGVRNDIERIMNGLDCCVLSSIREGFPNVVAEAMACGVPCVVTDAGDAARIVGDLKRVAPVGDHAKLAIAVDHVLSHPTCSVEIRESVLRQWSRERMVSRTMEVFRELS